MCVITDMFSATCPFYLKVSVASMHIGSTICALYHNKDSNTTDSSHTLVDMLIHSLFYLSNPLLKPLLSTAYHYKSVTALVLVYSSLSLLVACCTTAAALLPSVLVVKQAEVTVPRLVACLAFACLCMHACSWITSVTPVHTEYQVPRTPLHALCTHA